MLMRSKLNVLDLNIKNNCFLLLQETLHSFVACFHIRYCSLKKKKELINMKVTEKPVDRQTDGQTSNMLCETRPIAISCVRLANSNPQTNGWTNGPTKRLIELRACD